jgi:hypothetical protein
MHPLPRIARLAALAVVPLAAALAACGSDASDSPTSGPGSSSGSSGDAQTSSSSSSGGASSSSSSGGARADGGTPTDAAPGDGASKDAGSTDAGPITNDPFDPLSCTGTNLTYAQATALFKPGSSTRVLGSYVVKHRSRTCNPVTGCSAWDAPTQAFAAPPHDAVTGGFPTGGVAQLEAPPDPGFAVTFVLRLIDASSSMAFPSGTSQSHSTTTAGTLLWPSAPYVYTALDNHFIPALLVPEPLPGRFIAFPLDFTVTTSCLRGASSGETGVTDQYALLVRF